MFNNAGRLKVNIVPIMMKYEYRITILLYFRPLNASIPWDVEKGLKN